MAIAIRNIGMPTVDRGENLRRAERSAWYAHVDAREAVAIIPPTDCVRLDLARRRVETCRAVWAACLLALDQVNQGGSP